MRSPRGSNLFGTRRRNRQGSRSARLRVESLEGRELLTANLLGDLGQSPTSPLQIKPVTGGVYFSTLTGAGDYALNYLADGASQSTQLKVFPAKTGNSLTLGLDLADSAAYGVNGSSPTGLVFAADDGTGSGQQPWFATPNGAFELKDVGAGAVTSSPSHFTVFDNKVYFTATKYLSSSLLSQTILFRTNGTTLGTTEVLADPNSTNVAYLTGSDSLAVSGSNLLFTAVGITSGAITGNSGLWEVKAGESTARLLHTYPTLAGPPKTAGLLPQTSISNLGGLSFFPTTTAVGASSITTSLWVTDGSSGGTSAVLVNGKTILNPSSISQVGNVLYLAGTINGDSVSSIIRVTVSGSTATATKVESLAAGSSVLASFPAADSLIYAVLSGSGVQIRSIASGAGSSVALGSVSSDAAATITVSATTSARAVFAVRSAATDSESLWSASGTQLTKLVDKFRTATGTSTSSNKLVSTGDTVYFANTTDATGNELWKSDGTTASIVKDINPAAASSFPGALVAVGNRVFFGAFSGGGDSQLWASDGTSAGTTALLTGFAAANSGSNPNSAIQLNSKTLFFADDSLHGSSLFATDGTAAGTTRITSLTQSGNTSVFWGTVAHGAGYFLVNGPDGATGLWRTDGTAAGTTQIQSLNIRLARGTPVLFQGRLYFAIQGSAPGDSTTRVELWRTTANGLGAEVVASLANSSLSMSQLAVTKDANGNDARLFFVSDSDDATAPRILWSSTNGSSFQQVVNLNASLGSVSTGLGVLGSRVVFSYYDQANGVEPWISDGTAGGTMLLSNLVNLTDSHGNGFGSNPSTFVSAGNKVYFYASIVAGNSSGQFASVDLEPYVTDGTAAGTHKIADINPGVASSVSISDPTPIVIGANLFFVADDGSHGKELWRTDGTAAGTYLVKDIQPGAGSSLNFFNTRFTASGSTLLFTANNGTSGFQLWQTDGSPGYAQPISSFPPGYRVSDARVLLVAPTGLLLSASYNNNGAEPFFLAFENNTAPVLPNLPDLVANPATQVIGNVAGTDANAGQTLTYSVYLGPAGSSISPNGVFSWTPAPTDAGQQYIVWVKVSDSGVPALSAYRMFTIHVNAAPVIAAQPSLRLVTTNTTLKFKIGASDPQGVVYSLVSNPARGLKLDSNTGTVTWKPTTKQLGTYKVVVRVTEAGSAAPGLAKLSSLVTLTIRSHVPLVTIHSTKVVLNPRNKKQITSLQLSLAGGTFQAASALKASNYKLVLINSNGKQSTVAVRVSYRAGSKVVTLTPTKPLNASTGNYRLQVSNILDTKKNKLDGDNNGTAGGTYTVYIRKGKVTTS